MSKKEKKPIVPEAIAIPRKKGIGEWLFWGWVVLIIIAAIFMGYRFLYG